MGSMTTQDLHERADISASRGDFESALRYSAEALRTVPLDHRARLKVALCLAAFGQTDEAIKTLVVIADTLTRRGYFLPAIGACRDALGLAPESLEVKAALERIHGSIHKLEGRGRARTPPPSPPAAVEEEEASSLIAVRDASDLLVAAAELGTRDPDTTPLAPVAASAVPFFSDLSKDAFLSLVARMGYLKVPADHQIVREGEEGASLFVVVQGEAKVTRDEEGAPHLMATLGAGALFGELALIRAKPRGATVTTSHASELFEIAREAVEQVAASHPAITEDLVQFARRRLIMNLMATSKIFHPFDETQRLQILREFVSRVVPSGAVVIEEGREPSGLYLVLEGEFEVSKIDAGGDKVVLAYLREGEVFGEIALVEKRLTVATVSAAERSVVLYLDRARFDAFTSSHPKILEYLSSLSDTRRVETEQAMSADGVILDADDLIIV
jgi:CRP-like cAMP-binding protein